MENLLSITLIMATVGYYYRKYLNKQYEKINLDEYTLLAGCTWENNYRYENYTASSGYWIKWTR